MDSSRESGSGTKSRSSSGYSNQRPLPPVYPEGRAVAPFHQPVTPGHPYHPDQYPASEVSRPGQTARRQSVSMNPQLSPIPGEHPALAGPRGDLPAFLTPFLTPRRSASHGQALPPLPGVPSPWAAGTPSMWAPQPSVFDSPGFNIPIKAPQVEKSVDRVALPSEMPIGSNAHHQIPPPWGVAKITNIPYSITKQEIVQFVGRQYRIITPEKGCPIHIIMERSTAKTMDCYVEFDTAADAKEVVTRINRIYETGRAPRLGNRHVDVETSSQDALLKDLFPRAKCVVWKDGVPIVVANTDPYSSGFTGFFTREEIVGAMRHAEIPHRSPFCAKCPQRTYESTISTLGKFPWYATGLYTVNDRNMLFELVSRQVKALVARMKKCNTVGLDQRLLRELLYSGLKCPAFNERMKYTLCANSEDQTEIFRFQDMGKWFPFDTLVKLPNFDEQTLLYYVNLISKGTFQAREIPGLPNSFPQDNHNLNSPYGPIWFEWPQHLAKGKIWEHAVQHEMVILCNLVLSGWMKVDQQRESHPLEALRSRLSAVSMGYEPDLSETFSPRSTRQNRGEEASQNIAPQVNRPLADIFATPSRRAGEPQRRRFVSFSGAPNPIAEDDGSPGILPRPSTRGGRGGVFGHRNTRSSPIRFPPMQD